MIKMKKIILLLTIIFLGVPLMSQNSSANQMSGQSKGEWYKGSPEQSMYGIDLQGAKDLLKNKKIKKAPVIAIIGAGCDIEHEALKNSIWINSKEKINGIDDDNNGYIDDVNGWNFIGGKDGEVMENTLIQADREWLRLKSKYADLFYDGKNYFVYENGVRKSVNPPADMSEYNFFKSIITFRGSEIAGKYGGYMLVSLVKEYTLKLDSLIMNNYPDKNRADLNVNDVKHFISNDEVKKDSLKSIAHTVVYIYANMMNNFNKRTWQDVYDNFVNKQLPYSKKLYEELYSAMDFNSRKRVVGDDPEDISDKIYGNNRVLTTNSNSGTLFAGIIAGSNSDSNFEGIAPQAKIMPLVVGAGKGEPFIKDMVLSIRYAVDNGADIILLPQQGNFYNPIHKEWIHSAIKYADKKGVLVIVPVSEYSTDMDKNPYFPSTNMFPKSKLNNLITVGCSNQQGIPSNITNYGKNELDIFAPGKQIYSSLPGDIYAVVNSSSLGAVVVAGSSAFIKAYFSNLKGSEIKKLLIENATNLKDKEVELNINSKSGMVSELFQYRDLCLSGGVVNLKNSITSLIKNK